MIDKDSIKKKVLSFSLVAVLMANIGGTTAYAASSYMNDTILSNVTPMGMYADPTSGARYLYGGNVVFKFKDATRGVPPIFQFAPPKIKAGCNGISVTGGMLSMLGLDGIADQIQNAGTAVVYGILVGLIYSLPGLEKVFAHIRKWAEWLQSIMRDACSFGQQLGAQIGQTTAFQNTVGSVSSVMQSSIKEGDEWAQKTLLQPMMDGVDKMLGRVKDENAGKKDSTSGDEKDDRKGEASVNYRDFFRRLGIANVVLYDDEVKNGQFAENNYNLDVVQASSGGNHELYIILVNLFGDLTIDKKSQDFLVKVGNHMLKMIGDGYDNSGSLAAEIMAAFEAAFAQGNQGAASPSPVRIEYIKPTVNPERAAKIFVHGGSFATTTNGTVEEFKAPRLFTAKPAGAVNTTEAIFTFEITTATAPMEWKGLFATSKEKIDCEVEAKISGVACSKSFPLVLPGVGKYLETIATLERAGGKTNNQPSTETAQSQALKDDLAQHNAYFYAKFILNYIENEFRGSLLQIEGGSEALKFDTMFKERKEAIIAEIGNTVSTDAELLDKLRQRFINVDNDLKEQRMRR